MLATNLAGKIVSMITGDGSYIIGGCVSRKLTFPAFQDTVYIGTRVTDTSKVSVIDLSAYVYTYENNFDNNLRTFTIVNSSGLIDNNGDYLKICDLGVVQQNSTGNFYCNFEELV
jgi:predicted secreted protein